MKDNINDILKKCTVVKRSKTPATDNLFITNDSSPILSKLRREEFRSAVMTLHYLTERTRADILTAASYCATRVLSPTEDDYRKLDSRLELHSKMQLSKYLPLSVQ